MKRRHGWLLVSGVLIMTAGQLLIASPAHAEDELRVSSDARHWQPNLDRPLFDPAHRWVPGDTETTTFWIRNTASSAGVLRVTIDPIDHDQFLATGLQIRARTTGGGWFRLAADGSPRRIADTLPAGGTTRVWITTSFAAGAGNQSQDHHADVAVKVRLSERIGGPGTDLPGSTGPGPDGLAGTGTDGSEVLLLVGAAAIGLGWAIVRPTRLRRQRIRQ